MRYNRCFLLRSSFYSYFLLSRVLVRHLNVSRKSSAASTLVCASLRLCVRVCVCRPRRIGAYSWLAQRQSWSAPSDGVLLLFKFLSLARDVTSIQRNLSSSLADQLQSFLLTLLIPQLQYISRLRRLILPTNSHSTLPLNGWGLEYERPSDVQISGLQGSCFSRNWLIDGLCVFWRLFKRIKGKSY